MHDMLRRERLGFVAILLLYLGLSVVVFDQVEEDAFIYFRLVENVFHGYGVVFNRGGPPVEAGSSPLWLFLLLLLRALPLDLVITAKLLGLLMGCAALWVVYRLCRLHIRDPVLRLAPALLTAASTPFLMWSQRGLETPLFVLLVLWLVLCCSDQRKFNWWPVAATLLLTARPEGFFFLLAMLPAFVLHRDERKAIARGLLVVAVAAIILLAARFAYFHDFCPQPFYVKLRTGGTAGLHQIYYYLLGSHLYLLCIPLGIAGLRRRFWTRQRIVLVAFILTTASWCAIAKDYMPYMRHLVPALPLGYILLVGALDCFAAGAPGGRRALALGYTALVLVATLLFTEPAGTFHFGWESPLRTYLAAFATAPAAHLRETAMKVISPSTSDHLGEVLERRETLGTNYQSLVGQFLHLNYPAGVLVIYDQMGQTPFYAGADMRFVDSLGLTDRVTVRVYIERFKSTDTLLRLCDAASARARRLVFAEHHDAVTDAKGLDYLFGLDPDLILVNSFLVAIDPQGIPAQLARDPRLGEGYEVRYTLGGVVRLYERKGRFGRRLPSTPPGLDVFQH
jgi:hypothetical protein